MSHVVRNPTSCISEKGADKLRSTETFGRQIFFLIASVPGHCLSFTFFLITRLNRYFTA